MSYRKLVGSEHHRRHQCSAADGGFVAGKRRSPAPHLVSLIFPSHLDLSLRLSVYLRRREFIGGGVVVIDIGRR
ncbi:hypothetical protein HanRHA438_Chr01g0020901 [Helianthus annuus]|nr:hypothetical protein HanRHA438_Chr01g0020901 [Helianthus annuus]